jgi:hypothetical protein
MTRREREAIAAAAGDEPIDLTQGELLSNFAFIGLLGDSTSFEVNRPKGRFEEQKHYYDGKNKVRSSA